MGFEGTLIPSARVDAITLRIYGMTCSSCTQTVESGLLSVPGINSVAVSLISESAKIEFDRTLIGPREMVENIEEMGFDAMVSDEDNATQLKSLARTKEIQEWRQRFWRAFTFALPVFVISMVAPMIPFLRPIVHYRIMRGIYLGDLLSLILTVPAQFGLARNSTRILTKHSSTSQRRWTYS